MAQPSYYATGTTENISDPKLKRWTRILGVYQNRSGAKASNNPQPSNTVRQIKKKVLAALNAGSSGGGSGGGGTGDPNVDAFVSCANLTDPTQIAAVLALATGLKADGLWNSFDAIYPFVGGNANAHSCNLKAAGTFSISWNGGVTHNANGITGDGLTGYGDTGFNPSTAGGQFALNSAGLSFYSRTAALSATGTFMGCEDGSLNRAGVGRNAFAQYALLGLNEATTLSGAISTWYGNNAYCRTGATTQVFYTPADGTVSDSTVTIAIPNQNITILALQNNGVISAWAGANMAFAAIHSGFSAGQVTSLKARILTFETTLNRN